MTKHVRPTLVLGGNGKTGRRVVQRLADRRLAVRFPGAVQTVSSFAELDVSRNVSRLLLLSGRGEPEAEQAEQAVRASGAELTILRSTWFAQNLSEDHMLQHVLGGVLDGRNARLADGVQRALGRPPRDFAQYARDAAATGVFNQPRSVAA
jgi:uncharacterized protein YbjT (DUF2867 family)